MVTSVASIAPTEPAVLLCATCREKCMQETLALHHESSTPHDNTVHNALCAPQHSKLVLFSEGIAPQAAR
jgi:hypothetical protein